MSTGHGGRAHLHADTVTRPACPDPLYGFEVVHREDGADDDQWPFKTRITVPLAAASYLGYLCVSAACLLPPLDGEEGELIDDEACFFCPCDGDSIASDSGVESDGMGKSDAVDGERVGADGDVYAGDEQGVYCDGDGDGEA
ncbi:hypothetical protein B0H14DRAFT_3881033 [Mycena olivaceomarginata]|nr:hypothetical protein B0H14DRAFT_3881033 [Mycena olivaceomarginata]